MNALFLFMAVVQKFFQKTPSNQPLTTDEGVQEVQFLRNVRTYPIIEPQLYPLREK